ncbi:hypothetical protein AWZ03_004271 [Drosophila navojoa]|uniref:Uncharacterized protein n=1 Tax=Drosophila navojoa TaxID=7232 RepID=A0A484BKV4_DRONA|nr:hypothetical protein AWZ03_004271 [Drosophila navojoa]
MQTRGWFSHWVDRQKLVHCGSTVAVDIVEADTGQQEVVQLTICIRVEMAAEWSGFEWSRVESTLSYGH